VASQKARSPRPKVGLDEPCRQCGSPIYFNYRGPVPGLCGKCTDRSRKPKGRLRKSRRIGFFEGRRKTVSIVIAILLGLAVAALGGFLLLTLA
jgi:hypothetical protein